MLTVRRDLTPSIELSVILVLLHYELINVQLCNMSSFYLPNGERNRATARLPVIRPTDMGPLD